MTPANPTEANVISYAERLLRQYGLSGWSVSLSRATKVAGKCVYSEKTVYLSRPLIKARGIEAAKMTALHEVAHAVVGPGHSHGAVWKRQFLSMGGDGRSHFAVDTVDAEKLNTKYLGVCPTGHKFSYSRQPSRRRSCPTCNPRRYDARYEIRITLRTTGQEVGYALPKPKRAPVRKVRITLPDGRSFLVPSRF